MPGDPRPRVVSTAASPPVDTELTSASHTPRHDNHPTHDPSQRRAHVSRSALHLTGVRGSHKPAAQTARSRCTRRRLALALDVRSPSSTAASTLATPSPRSQPPAASTTASTWARSAAARSYALSSGRKARACRTRRPNARSAPTRFMRQQHRPLAPTRRRSPSQPPLSRQRASRKRRRTTYRTSSRSGTGGAAMAHSTSFWRAQFPFLSTFHSPPCVSLTQAYLCRRAPALRVRVRIPSASRPRERVDTLKTNNTPNSPPHH